jgi:hypothetical protein
MGLQLSKLIGGIGEYDDRPAGPYYTAAPRDD